MAGRQNTSFLKRQKERKRLEKATAKREARQARREAKAAGNEEPFGGPIEEPVLEADEPETDEAPEQPPADN